MQTELARIEGEHVAQDARAIGDDFAARTGRESTYDDAGAPTFHDGTAYPLSDIGRFYDQHIAGTQPKDGAPMPDVLFRVGHVDDATAQGLHDFLPGFNDGLREARISAQSLKHIQDSRPSIVRDVLTKLEQGALRAGEVLPNPVNRDRALIVLHDAAQTAGSKPKHLSHVIEVSANGKGIDIVTVMSARDGALKGARKLRDELTASKKETSSGGATYPSSSLEAGRTQQPHAAADFPAFAQDQGGSITDAGRAATDPEALLVHDIVSRNPEALVNSGYDADGQPIKVRAADALAEIEAEHQTGVKEAQSFMAAIKCMLGG